MDGEKKGFDSFHYSNSEGEIFFTKFVDLWVEGRMVSVKSAGGVTV